jgi:hypothetical protein
VISPQPSASLPSPTAAAPFLGTPAQTYADGASGIVLPPAEPVGSYTATQVTAAYQKAKQLLTAANLDSATLAGRAPDAFAGLLIPQQRAEFLGGLYNTGRSPSGYPNSTRAWVTSFASGTQLVGHVIKVHGSMYATTASDNGSQVLRIRADYLFVYPVQRHGEPSTLMRVVDREVVNVDFGAVASTAGAFQPWWGIAGGGDAGALCNAADGFVHPQFPGKPSAQATAKGRAVDPYDQSTPAPGRGTCHPVTGT